jgi:hypothetical protein
MVDLAWEHELVPGCRGGRRTAARLFVELRGPTSSRDRIGLEKCDVPLLMSRRTNEPGGQARPPHKANRRFTYLG